MVDKFDIDQFTSDFNPSVFMRKSMMQSYALPKRDPQITYAAVAAVEPPDPELTKARIHEMMATLQESMQKRIAQAMCIPDDILNAELNFERTLNRHSLHAAVENFNVATRQFADRVSTSFNRLMSMPIFRHHIPGPFIGHWFNHEIAPSKHRSKRLWKKLRYGTRKNPRVHRMYGEPPVYVINEPPALLANPASINEITRSM